jgi:small membrane protein
MTMFQEVGLLLMAVMISLSVYNIVRRRGRFRVSLMWLLIWCVGAVALIRPQTAIDVARAMGIGRGADLIFYCNVLITLIGFFTVYLRQRRIEQHITVLVRELALAHGGHPRSPELPASGSKDETDTLLR